MSADQVAMLQSVGTEDELNMVAGLGMVRAVLQSNFKAINGAQVLEDIHKYAHYRLGRKGKRPPQNPWHVLAELFEAAQQDDSGGDIHQRVCNALVQWVVREILGSTRNRVDSKACFHAVYLVSLCLWNHTELSVFSLSNVSSSVIWVFSYVEFHIGLRLPPLSSSCSELLPQP